MTPSPPSSRKGPSPPTFGTVSSANQSRSPFRPPQPAMRRPAGAATGTQLTPAEAYASEHTPKRDKENVQSSASHQPNAKTKPLFGWITRRLGAGRRATYSDGSTSSPSRYLRDNKDHQALHGRGAAKGGNDVRQFSPGVIFGPAVSTRENSVTRTESHSLRSYSMPCTNSADRRIANNPYPSIPVSTLHRGSVVDTISESFFSRSRTPSLRSERSRPVRSLYDMDDVSSRWMNGGGADEDASLRPFPPSHPSSPTPSQSLLSRSASASLLSPISQLHRPSSYLSRTQRSMSTSTGSSDLDLPEGRQSRQDSTSTKPTILSFDSNQHVAHIAQAPASASVASPTVDLAISRRSTLAAPPTAPSTPADTKADFGAGGSAPAAALDTSLESPISPQDGFSASPAPSSPSRASLHHAQAPKRTQPHPRDNPRPSAPPEPNASTLTLASSTFAMASPAASSLTQPAGPLHPGTAGSRLREVTGIAQPSGSNRPSTLSTSPSVTFASEAHRPPSAHDSISTHGPSAPSVSALSGYGPSAGNMSIRTGGWRGGADGDASVRALRRKGSWESEGSVWSWREQKYGPSAAASNLGNPAANRLSAYIGQDEDPSSTFYANSGSVTRESFITAQSKLSRGSH